MHLEWCSFVLVMKKKCRLEMILLKHMNLLVFICGEFFMERLYSSVNTLTKFELKRRFSGPEQPTK